ncbi:SNF2-related protein [Macrococcus lamae]|uniref:Helicase SNF2 n=1 Tax=Macrococcus lamae TaxID=198484 RepID=A0A4R6BTS2_9STAP|nr:SNF2-related protein [Macrococcus lamae]TDM07714.1 helicase SNF2 [Macrococcus lamae]
MLRNLENILSCTYDSTINDITNDFYIPVLSEAIVYKRVSCYFSSKSLSIYATGLDKFAENGGYMQLIISEDISEDDYQEIIKGYEERTKDEILDEEDLRKLGNLAYLISIGKADVKLGFVDNGLFHSKWGLFKDKNDDYIYFNGSNNETASAINKNYESFDVDYSWDTSANVQKRVNERIRKFDLLWGNRFQGTTVIDITDLTYEIIKKYNKGQIIQMTDFNNALVLSMEDNQFLFKDFTDGTKTNKSSFVSKFSAYTDEERPFPYLSLNIDYLKLERIIDIAKKQSKKKEFKFIVSPEVINFINQNKYSIEEYRKTGLTLKNKDERWTQDFITFSNVVNEAIDRPLLKRQLESAFYMMTQKRAANFSVPGAGKTAMILGVFAYLNSKHMKNPMKRMLVICPKNAFKSWKDEFKLVFGSKKSLYLLNVQDEKIRENLLDFEIEWFQANLILVNYESLKRYRESIIKCLRFDANTMLIFDEVHRVKGLSSSRAEYSLEISRFADYKYVLTGTPIPNSYQDIYNFLHIMYYDEYDKHFGYQTNFLKNPNAQDELMINEKLSPYFWRINKDQLNVPKAEDDKIIKVSPSIEQLQLAESIYLSGHNSLATLIRLIQLSTNPELIAKSIQLKDFGLSDEDYLNEEDEAILTEQMKNNLKNAIHNSAVKNIANWDLSKVNSPKFNRGIELIKELIAENKKVLVWALFVDTIHKIKNELINIGISTEIIYGATPNDEREEIIETYKEDNNKIQVLISNPNTLGESVSLHKAVHDAIYFEYNFNLTFILQSRDRIHRLGLNENDKTNYYVLMTDSTQDYYNFIDEKIYESLKLKEERMRNAIDSDILRPEFTDTEFEEAKSIIMSERKF